jgi:hypothetical protein
MPGLDSSIIEHRIDTWPDITPVRQKQCPLHPSKEVAIKAEIDKLCTAGFIYPITYTSWVSNPVPVNKKQGTIRVCTDFHDLNHTCPKDNFPTPFIDQIIDDCVGHEALSFMDGFSSYNQIQIHPADQYKTAFTTPWGTFSYRVMPFGLKNAGATFQRAMTYIFMIWLKSFSPTWMISPLDPRNTLNILMTYALSFTGVVSTISA